MQDGWFGQLEHKYCSVTLSAVFYSLLLYASSYHFLLPATKLHTINGTWNIQKILITMQALRFMFMRVNVEEEFLESFFGDEWTLYKNRVWSGLPWIS